MSTTSKPTEPEESAHSPPPTVDDPAKRETLRRIGTGAATVATIGAASSSDALPGSPVGRARAAPPLAAYVAAVGVMAAANMLVGQPSETRDSAEYLTLERLALWADAIRTFGPAEASNLTLEATASDLAEFSVNRLMAEATLEAMHAVREDDADWSEALEAGEKKILEEGAVMEENVLDHRSLHNTEIATFVGDADVISDFNAADAIEVTDPESSYEYNWLEVAGNVNVTFDLLDGETWSRELPIIRFSTTVTNTTRTRCLHPLPEALNEYSDGELIEYDENGDRVDYDGQGYPTYSQEDFIFDSDSWRHYDETQAPGVHIIDWPEDEYDELDPETRENIEPPEEPSLNPVLWDDTFEDTLTAIYDAVDQAYGEFETYLNGIWDDLVDDDTELHELMTPTMLAELAADHETYPYATAGLAAMGIPTTAESVTLRFPEVEDPETGEPAESTGHLFAHPMPASGFNVGSTYDPGELDSNFYYAYHTVDEDGHQTSEIIQLEDTFEIIAAHRVDTETGEVEEVDDIEWSERGFTGSEADYDELIAALQDVADIEQKITIEQEEIVVELEGEAKDDGGSIGLPSIGNPFDGDGSVWLGLGLIGAGIAGAAAFVFGRD